jgi:transcriptional regulator with XRE-family HTH domain
MLSKSRFTEILASNVKHARIAKSYTQDELSHKCGFYRTYINLVETAKRTPSSYSLYRIASALKVKVDDLYPSTV